MKFFKLGDFPELVFFIVVGLSLVGGAFFFFPELFALIFSEQFKFAYRVLYNFFPFWGPPLLAYAFFMVWTGYVRGKFLAGQKYVLLEVRLPREVNKSPLAMELALAGFYITSGESTWYDVYILGKVRTWFSFEIVSDGGNIHFYIWTRETFRPVVEAQLYGQYPDIELFEVSDYTTVIPEYNPEQVVLVGHEYGLDKPDPYPIKTYVDYGLDKDPKEEFKIDPLTSVLEYMGSLKKGEHLWLQIIFRSHKKKKRKGTFFETTDIQEEAKDEIHKLLEELKQEKPSTDGTTFSYSRIPTKSEAEVMAAIDRNSGKLNFDCGIRMIYAGKPKEAFVGSRIPAVINLLRAFTSKELNGFGVNWGTYTNYPWEDFRNIRMDFYKKKLVHQYRMRSWFHGPYSKAPFILSSEELATIFHFPGGVLQAPSVERVMSKKAEAPGNLPQ